VGHKNLRAAKHSAGADLAFVLSTIVNRTHAKLAELKTVREYDSVNIKQKNKPVDFGSGLSYKMSKNKSEWSKLLA
jgi:hypothetical protein